MITNETLRQCAYLNSISLEGLIRKNYPKDVVVQSNFLGITNSGQFCYDIAYPEEGELRRSKVFVYIDNNGKVTADY
jgi:hypothetical protein